MGYARNLATVNTLVIHCSASPNGALTSAREIDAWHAARGFQRDLSIAPHHAPQLPHIGYHFVLRSNGVVDVGRPLREIGAHAAGHNARSIGVCLIGTDRFTRAQWEALAGQIASLTMTLAEARRLQGLPRTGAFGRPSPEDTLALIERMRLAVLGHRDLSPDRNGDGTVEPREWLKTCPNFDVATWLAGGLAPLQDHLLSPADPRRSA